MVGVPFFSIRWRSGPSARIGWPLRCSERSQRITRGPEDEGDQQRGQARRARAEGDVAEQVEQDELVRERTRAGCNSIRLRPPRGPTRSSACDHVAHPAAQAALDQDGVAGPHRARDDRRQGRGIGGVHGVQSFRHRVAQAAHQRPAGEQQVGRLGYRVGQRQHARPGLRRPAPACRPAPRGAAAPAAAAAPQAPRASRRRCRCSFRRAAARSRPAPLRPAP